MADPINPTSTARRTIANAIDSHRDGDVLALARLISLLDGQRQGLECEDEGWLASYEHHTRVLDEMYALTQQSRWSRFGRRKRRIVREELAALRSLIE
jgi:hypothetical protein